MRQLVHFPEGQRKTFRHIADSVRLLTLKAMAKNFQTAFLWHLENGPHSLAEIERGSGVTRSVLNKLKFRDGVSTTAENAIAIAHFYGKSLEEFIALEEPDRLRVFADLWDGLTDQERRVVEATMRAIAQQRQKPTEESASS